MWHFNVGFSCALLNKAIVYEFPIKYASSASVYGNQSVYQKSKTYNPLNQYAISKLQIDYTVMDNIDQFTLVQGFRYFNVYGDGEEHKGNQASPVSKFTKEIRPWLKNILDQESYKSSAADSNAWDEGIELLNDIAKDYLDQVDGDTGEHEKQRKDVELIEFTNPDPSIIQNKKTKITLRINTDNVKR